jgi:hypothetical protein
VSVAVAVTVDIAVTVDVAVSVTVGVSVATTVTGSAAAGDPTNSVEHARDGVEDGDNDDPDESDAHNWLGEPASSRACPSKEANAGRAFAVPAKMSPASTANAAERTMHAALALRQPRATTDGGGVLMPSHDRPTARTSGTACRPA